MTRNLTLAALALSGMALAGCGATQNASTPVAKATHAVVTCTPGTTAPTALVTPTLISGQIPDGVASVTEAKTITYLHVYRIVVAKMHTVSGQDVTVRVLWAPDSQSDPYNGGNTSLLDPAASTIYPGLPISTDTAAAAAAANVCL